MKLLFNRKQRCIQKSKRQNCVIKRKNKQASQLKCKIDQLKKGKLMRKEQRIHKNQ